MFLRLRVEFKVKLLFLTVLCFAGNTQLYAQTPGTASPDSVLTGISVSEDHGTLAITLPIHTIPVSPKISKLKDPDRLVFDFAGVLPQAGLTRTKVGTHSVKAVRAAIFGNDARGRPITRVVLDLDKPVSYETKSEPGKFLVLVHDDAGATAPAASSDGKAPSPAPKTATSAPVTSEADGNRLTDVDFGDSIVTLTFASPVSPRKSMLHDPDRLVLDLPGVVAGRPSTKSVPDTLRTSVTGIRMAQFKENPPVYRIVFDEPSPNVSSELAVDANQVTVRFGLRPAVANRITPKTANPAMPNSIRPSGGMSAGSTAKRATVPTRETPSVGMKREVPSGGPNVDYTNGLLRIEATNANLADILYAVGEKTGATIDMPFSDSMLDQVTFSMGPGKPRDVLSTILEGSGFNYYIVENSAGALEKIILIPKQQ